MAIADTLVDVVGPFLCAPITFPLGCYARLSQLHPPSPTLYGQDAKTPRLEFTAQPLFQLEKYTRQPRTPLYTMPSTTSRIATRLAYLGIAATAFYMFGPQNEAPAPARQLGRRAPLDMSIVQGVYETATCMLRAGDESLCCACASREPFASRPRLHMIISHRDHGHRS